MDFEFPTIPDADYNLTLVCIDLMNNRTAKELSYKSLDDGAEIITFDIIFSNPFNFEARQYEISELLCLLRFILPAREDIISDG